MRRLLRLSHSRAPMLAMLVVLVVGAIGIGRGAPANAQADKDTLIVAVGSDIQNLDPTLSSADIPTQEMLTNIYDWLIDYQVTTDANGQQVGDPSNFLGGLAEKFEWNADGTAITFTLREGLKFSNGDPLDAEAVKFTYDRIFDQNGVTPFLLSMAAVPDKDHVKVIDARTIQFIVDT